MKPYRRQHQIFDSYSKGLILKDFLDSTHMICIAMRNKNIIQLFYSLRFQKRNNSILPDFRDIAAASIYKTGSPIGCSQKNSIALSHIQHRRLKHPVVFHLTACCQTDSGRCQHSPRKTGFSCFLFSKHPVQTDQKQYCIIQHDPANFRLSGNNSGKRQFHTQIAAPFIQIENSPA